MKGFCGGERPESQLPCKVVICKALRSVPGANVPTGLAPMAPSTSPDRVRILFLKANQKQGVLPTAENRIEDDIHSDSRRPSGMRSSPHPTELGRYTDLSTPKPQVLRLRSACGLSSLRMTTAFFAVQRRRDLPRAQRMGPADSSRRKDLVLMFHQDSRATL